MKLSELDTPALILDRGRLEANVARMSARGEMVVDAGGLALSRDRSTQAGRRDIGYGLVVDAAAYEGYHVVAGSDEIEAEWPRVNGW